MVFNKRRSGLSRKQVNTLNAGMIFCVCGAQLVTDEGLKAHLANNPVCAEKYKEHLKKKEK